MASGRDPPRKGEDLHFTQFIAIDWSGQAVERPKGLAVARCHAGSDAPKLVEHPGGWSRPALADWLLELGARQVPALIGLDLSPAFPHADAGAFFPGWAESPTDAVSLWAMVETFCTDDPYLGASSFVAHPQARRHFRQRFDCGDLFPPGRGRFRVVEHGQEAMQLSPYSCFNLVGASQVGKSSLTGMRVLHRLTGKVPIWPFDAVPENGPVVVEIYTSLAARQAGIRKGRSKIRDGSSLDTALAAFDTVPHAPLANYADHATDAILSSAWLRWVAGREEIWNPPGLTPDLARTEGWTFGVI
jgi:hypothetical protein